MCVLRGDFPSPLLFIIASVSSKTHLCFIYLLFTASAVVNFYVSLTLRGPRKAEGKILFFFLCSACESGIGERVYLGPLCVESVKNTQKYKFCTLMGSVKLRVFRQTREC